MKYENGNWTEYRKLPYSEEVDFHFDNSNSGYASYEDKMAEANETTLKRLKAAHEEGVAYLIFTHGHSTSRIGKTTTRSVIRGLMRSKEATPYINRKECIQHYSVFVAAIREKPGARDAYKNKLDKEAEARKKEAAEDYPRYLKEFLHLITFIPDEEHRRLQARYPDRLKKDYPDDIEKWVERLSASCYSMQDQINRDTGIFSKEFQRSPYAGEAASKKSEPEK